MSESIHDLRIFSGRIKHSLPATSHDPYRLALSDLVPLKSIYRAENEVQNLSELEQKSIECCKNSCCAFDGAYRDEKKCPFCQANRYLDKAETRAANYFHPIPITPRLQALFSNRDKVIEMRYHVEEDQRHDSDDSEQLVLNDIFDGRHYQTLQGEYVRLSDPEEVLEHRFFSDSRDIALGLSLDGFTFYEDLGRKESKNTYNSWALILINYNLPPDQRTLQKNIIFLCFIPGPGQPKDLNSFLVSLVEELTHLARGIPNTYDADTCTFFCLHAYLIIVFGDMPAIVKAMCMKGHNGMSCCRICSIIGQKHTKATAMQQGGQELGISTTYYPALQGPDGVSVWTIRELVSSPRTHKDFDMYYKEINALPQTPKHLQDGKCKQYGVNKKSILFNVPGINFGRSFPHDLMHAIFENTVGNLVSWWTGCFKGLDQGNGNFCISDHNWERIGQLVEETMKYIPSTFVRRLLNLANSCSSYTAEGWSFWMIHLAPILLKEVLPDPYYTHFIDLVRLTKMAMQYSIPEQTVLRDFSLACSKWVTEYERYVNSNLHFVWLMVLQSVLPVQG